jgi:hypothetical protein
LCLRPHEKSINDSLTIPYDVQTPITIATPTVIVKGSDTPTTAASRTAASVLPETVTPSPSNQNDSGSAPIGPIVGGIVGGVIVLGAIIGIAVFYLKRQKYDRPAVVNRISMPGQDNYYDKQLDSRADMEASPQSPAAKSINSELPIHYNPGFQREEEERFEAVPSGRLRYEI